jgi:hypothetical protein
VRKGGRGGTKKGKGETQSWRQQPLSQAFELYCHLVVIGGKSMRKTRTFKKCLGKESQARLCSIPQAFLPHTLLQERSIVCLML